MLAQKSGDIPLAVTAYSHAVQLHPSDYGYLLLAEAYDAGGQKEQAAAARQKAELVTSNIHAAQRQADEILTR